MGLFDGIIDSVSSFLNPVEQLAGPGMEAAGLFTGDPILGSMGAAIGSLGSALSPAIPSLISGGLGYLGAQQQQSFSAGQAAQQMDFQDQQAQKNRDFAAQQAQLQRQYGWDTRRSAYQDATADMKAAGINPMLAYMKGGADTPSGAAASAPGTPTGAMGMGVNKAAAATAAAAQTADTQNTLNMQDRTKSETALNIAQAAKAAQDATTSKSTAAQLDQLTQNLAYELENLLPYKGTNLQYENVRHMYENKILQESWADKVKGIKLGVQAQGLEIPGLKAEAAMYDRAGGQAIPYLGHASSAINSAAAAAAAGARYLK